MSKKLPTGWSCRPNTMDRIIAEQVICHNEYRLPGSFSAGDIVMDVGSHIGSFAYAALSRGAGEVHCFEANPENAVVVRQNMARFPGRAWVREAAVVGDNMPRQLFFHKSSDPQNTGGGGLNADPAGVPISVVRFDDVLDEVTGPGRRVRMLKLDCEGSEWSILLTSKRLHLIDEICGEYHLPPAGQCPDWNLANLRRHLERHGFHVRFPRRPVHGLGLFFASTYPQSARPWFRRLLKWCGLQRAS